MRCRLFTLLVTIMSCAVVTGCSTSQWVTDTRAEFIREGTKTVVRPVLSIVRYPEDKPELIVQLSQELSGQRVLEEHKHEQIHKIWEPNIVSFSIGLLGLAASPFYMVGSTLGGQPAVGFKMLKSSALTIVGFEGIDQQDRRGESTIEVTPMGIGTEIIPWGNAPVDLFVERMPPIKKWTDQTGKLVVDLKVLPMDIVHPKKDLHLTVSTEANGVAVRENVTITVATVMSWPAKAAEFARKEQERLVQIARQERDKKEQEERQAVAKREREAQEAREARARAEYERQHPEIARAREAEAAAQQQCAQCKSSCDSQALGCTAACFGNLADTMCSGRCQVALNTCKNGCEEQRDALIVQAGGTPLGTSSSGTATLLQGLVTMGDSLAAAKGLPSSATSRFATSATPSMQTSVASFAQALSALAGSTVTAPGSKRSSSQSAKAEGASSALDESTCDVSAEDLEIEAMKKRIPIEVKGMGKKRRACYAAKQYVKIAHFQIRAATRCNLDLAEPKEELHDAEVQEREFCRDLSMK